MFPPSDSRPAGDSRAYGVVTFYTKPDCPLCERALALLEIAARRRPFRIEIVNILTESQIYEQYRDRIPVLVFPDGTTLEAPIRRDQLFSTVRRCCP